MCEKELGNVTLTQPQSGMNINSELVNNVTCNGLDDGSIDIDISGGTGLYTYSWSNGETTQDISNLSPGIIPR